MIQSVHRAADGTITEHLTPSEIEAVLQEKDGLLWVDIVEEPRETCEVLLRNFFGFHPLAIDDALDETHVPKVDDWDDYLYLVLHAVVFNPDELVVDTVELDVFLGQNYLVTYQDRAIETLGRIWDASQRDKRRLSRGAGYLLYTVTDELVMDYMPVVEDIDQTIDEIQDEVFNNPRQVVLEQIFALKRATVHLRRIIGPQREALSKLARGDFLVVAQEDRIFFRDVYDHLVRLHDIAEGLRDLVGSVLDTYLSVVNNRLNEVMKILTIITTLFMPIAFLTGFFGMNFFQPTYPLPAWTNLPMFLVVLAIVVLLPIGMFLWMRRRAWM